MVFPWLILMVACFALLAYFARNKVTYTLQKGSTGSLGMAFVALIAAIIIAYAIDIYLKWSIIAQYMYAAGGALQIIGVLFFAAFGLLCLSMLISAKKCGTMVS